MQLAPLPLQCNFYQPHILFYHCKQDGKKYILFTPDMLDHNSVIAYDIHLDEYIMDFARYPSDFAPSKHGHIVNTESNKLYVLSGESEKLGVYDLINCEWNIHSYCNVPKEFLYPSMCLIENDDVKKYKIHAFSDKIHIKLKEKSNIFISCANDQIYDTDDFPHSYQYINESMMYIGQKMLIFGGHNDSNEIFEYDVIRSKSYSRVSWKKCNLKLPKPMKFKQPQQFGYFIAFKCIVVIIEFKQKQSWSLDIGHKFDEHGDTKYSQWKIFKIKDYENNEIGDDNNFVVLSDENFVHFMNLNSSNKIKNNHYTISLSKVIPFDLCEKYAKPIISGYINGFQRSVKIYHVLSSDIIELIFRFYV